MVFLMCINDRKSKPDTTDDKIQHGKQLCELRQYYITHYDNKCVNRYKYHCRMTNKRTTINIPQPIREDLFKEQSKMAFETTTRGLKKEKQQILLTNARHVGLFKNMATKYLQGQHWNTTCIHTKRQCIYQDEQVVYPSIEWSL